MKTVALRGGLGNQLFCLAFAHTVRLLGHGPVALVVDAGQARPTPGFDMAALATELGLVVARAGVKAADRVHRQKAPSADLESLRAFVASGDHFVGYWQHPSYILEPDVLRSVVGEFLRDACPPAPGRDVAIHYRAYQDERLPWRRGRPPTNYFAGALASLPPSKETPVVVSDRPDLARRRLRGIGEADVIGGSLADHLAILLRARRLVLANSSLSWWAGFVGDAERPIYPKRRGCFHYPAPAAKFTLL